MQWQPTQCHKQGDGHVADRDIHPIERWDWAEPYGYPLDPGVKLFALQELEQRYRTTHPRLRSEWDQMRLQALALWRLHRQQL
jgi:hypothetical protein